MIINISTSSVTMVIKDTPWPGTSARPARRCSGTPLPTPSHHKRAEPNKNVDELLVCLEKFTGDTIRTTQKRIEDEAYYRGLQDCMRCQREMDAATDIFHLSDSECKGKSDMRNR